MTTANIAFSLRDRAATSPDQPALRWGPPDAEINFDGRGPVSDVEREAALAEHYRSLTFAELWRESQTLAAGLAAYGVTRGMKTVLMVPPSPEFFALTFALFEIGAIPVLVDPGMGIRNLKKCLAEAEPAAFVGVPKAHAARTILRWSKESLKLLVTVGRRLWWQGRTLDEIRALGRKSPPRPIVEMDRDEMAAILFTSGSTGIPKGAVYTHGIFTGQVEALRTMFGIEPGETDLCTFPLFALFAPALGMSAVIPQMDFTRPATVDPPKILGPVHGLAVNNLFGSPALLNRVSRYAERHDIRLPTVKRVLSAGAPVSDRILERMAGRLSPGVQIFTPYGATEALPVAIMGSDEILADTRHRTAQGAGICVGRPVAMTDVRIVRISDEPIERWDESLVEPAGSIGEIAVRGPTVTREYYRRPVQTRLAKIPDPATNTFWHRMGDLGYFDAQGRLWFCGRKSHRVVTPAGTLYTDPCEGIFNAQAEVFRTALVGVIKKGVTEPVILLELRETAEPSGGPQLNHARFLDEIRTLAKSHPMTAGIGHFLIHPRFPVDIRHNSKIFREKLSVWAATKLGGEPVVR